MNRSPEEAKADYVETMGEPLGMQFHALWQATAWLYLKFSEFVELFGTKPERVARLTDPSKSSGTKRNLTLCNLPHLMRDPVAAAALQELVDIANRRLGFVVIGGIDTSPIRTST